MYFTREVKEHGGLKVRTFLEWCLFNSLLTVIPPLGIMNASIKNDGGDFPKYIRSGNKGGTNINGIIGNLLLINVEDPTKAMMKNGPRGKP